MVSSRNIIHHLCLASQKPSEWEFFVPARTDLGVALLSISDGPIWDATPKECSIHQRRTRRQCSTRTSPAAGAQGRPRWRSAAKSSQAW